MTDDQHVHRPRSAPQLAGQGVRRPRRSPAESAPRIAEADRPSDAELVRARRQAQRRWVPRSQ